MNWKAMATVISMLLSTSAIADSETSDKVEPQSFQECIRYYKRNAKDPRPLYQKCKSKRASLAMTQQEIQAGITWYLTEIRKCYEKALVKETKLSGSLTIAFKISKKGDVTTCEYTKGLKSTLLRACVCPTVKKWHFPENDAKEAVTVTYPFRFTQFDDSAALEQ